MFVYRIKAWHVEEEGGSKGLGTACRKGRKGVREKTEQNALYKTRRARWKLHVSPQKKT